MQGHQLKIKVLLNKKQLPVLIFKCKRLCSKAQPREEIPFSSRAKCDTDHPRGKQFWTPLPLQMPLQLEEYGEAGGIEEEFGFSLSAFIDLL